MIIEHITGCKPYRLEDSWAYALITDGLFWFCQHCETANQPHGGETFQWTPEMEVTFQTLKGDLHTVCICTYPQPGERSVIDTDVSHVGIAGALSQIEDGCE